MNPLILSPILEAGSQLISRLFPDKEKAAEAEREFLKLVTTQEFSVVLKQLEINAVEAAHPSVWVSGWRPAFGWVGAAGFFYQVIGRSLITWLCQIKGWPEPPPLSELETELFWAITLGLLGIGGMRTFEKKNRLTK